ncbi:MAG: rhomboid family intramembrane serine protease [Acidimicrobiia bacterium]|nr:rhomboid family intramembrane serine protease [Acidimicrobiia bacterium]
MGSHCLECAKAARPDLATRARFWSAGQSSLVTYALIAANVLVFIGVILWTGDMGAISGQVTTAHLDLGLSREVIAEPIIWDTGDGLFVTQPDGWYRLITSGFLHFGILHLAFNMYFLYVIGPMLEQPLGRTRFALLYFASLLGGSFGVILSDSGSITAGASGAVFGLLGAATVGLWRRGVNPFSTGIGTALLINLFITFAMPGISIGGHLGGAAVGALCALTMLAPDHQRVPRWATYATPLALGFVCIVGSVMLVNSG